MAHLSLSLTLFSCLFQIVLTASIAVDLHSVPYFLYETFLPFERDHENANVFSSPENTIGTKFSTLNVIQNVGTLALLSFYAYNSGIT